MAVSNSSSAAVVVRVDSRLLAVFLAAGAVIYTIVLFDSMRRLPAGLITFALYALAGLVLASAIWSSATVLELYADHIRQTRLFGFGPSLSLALRDVVKIRARPNYDGYVTRITLVSAKGERIRLHRYQRNFQSAREYLRRNLAALPEELESKWSL